MFFFVEEENQRTRPAKNPRSTNKNERQTQPTYGIDFGIRTWAILVRGERSLHCAILVPLFVSNSHFEKCSLSNIPFRNIKCLWVSCHPLLLQQKRFDPFCIKGVVFILQINRLSYILHHSNKFFTGVQTASSTCTAWVFPTQNPFRICCRVLHFM